MILVADNVSLQKIPNEDSTKAIKSLRVERDINLNPLNEIINKKKL
jgi:hypothetical protein